jgi:hypothetical protein
MKQMAEMPFALAAEYFCSFGEKADVVFQGDIANVDGFDEAGPAGARLELGFGAKKRLSASCADIGALIGAVPIFSRKGLFSPFLTEKMVLFFRELLFPLIVG